MFLCISLLLCSISGTLTPLEGVAATPLNIVSGFFNRIGQTISGFVTDLAEVQNLRERNAELEETIAGLTIEVVGLREIGADYQRLADILGYTNTREDLEFVTADVINIDLNGFPRTIVINRGTRSGVDVGMAVITDQGLVGRVINVFADIARVQLIVDENSFISARLQTTRAEGSVVGQPAGTLLMSFIPLDATIQEDDVVITSGLGGNLPPDILIGVVTSARRIESELYQEAVVRSLINFDSLEIVLVITSFRPVDFSVFETEN